VIPEQRTRAERMASHSSSASASPAVSAEVKAKAEARKEEGNRRYKAGEYPTAVSEYSAAIELDPSNPAYYSNRGAALMMTNQFEEAIADCDKAIELKPSFLKAYLRGATARLRIVSEVMLWPCGLARCFEARREM
jgi:Flp pilus assembly protein TadD